MLVADCGLNIGILHGIQAFFGIDRDGREIAQVAAIIGSVGCDIPPACRWPAHYYWGSNEGLENAGIRQRALS